MRIRYKEFFDFEKILERGEQLHKEELMLAPDDKPNRGADQEANSIAAKEIFHNNKIIKDFFISEVFMLAKQYFEQVGDKKMLEVMFKIETYVMQTYSNALLANEKAHSMYDYHAYKYKLLNRSESIVAKENMLKRIIKSSKEYSEKYINPYADAMIKLASTKEPCGEKYEQVYDILSTIAESGAVVIKSKWKVFEDPECYDEYYELRKKIKFDKEKIDAVFQKLQQKYHSDSNIRNK